MNEEELEQTETPEETPETTEIAPETSETIPEISESSETPPKKPMNPKVLGGIVGVVAVVGLCVGLFSGGTTAKEMRLEKYTGSVTLHNNTEEKQVFEGARLISQDNLETFSDSSAYIVLDDVKVLKADEETHMEVVKVDEDLDIELYKGSLYFSVTKPLSDMETLEFHTNNVVTGVRGTSGVITYTEDVLQSQVVVLSGTVEVITIEEEPETVLVNQGEIAIATTQEDGTVELEVKEQEKTPSYSFSTNFLDDSGEDVEEYTLPDWKTDYAQYLFQIEEDFQFHFNPDPNENYIQSEYCYPPDPKETTYWLHDIDLDGIPELFFRFYYETRGMMKGRHHQVNFIYMRGSENGNGFYNTGAITETTVYFDTGLHTRTYLAIPENGMGIYGHRYQEPADRNTPAYTYTHEYWLKEGRSLVNNHTTDGSRNAPFLGGTHIDTSTWTHYTDLSGLDWNG